jgi:hypothetical protein
MESTFHEVYGDVEKAIDFAFNGQFVLKFYEYLKIRKTKRYEVEEFIESFTASEISNLVLDLDDYLEGGSDDIHKQLREAYGYLPKPQARKIRNQEDGKNKLNKNELHINRGVELLLRNRRKRKSKPKTFQVKFGKMISLFCREFHFFIEFHFDVKKK